MGNTYQRATALVVRLGKRKYTGASPDSTVALAETLVSPHWGRRRMDFKVGDRGEGSLPEAIWPTDR